MPDFLTLSADEQDDQLAEAIAGREREIAAYQLNEQNYQTMLDDPELADLPDRWPAHLSKYRTAKPHEVAERCSPNDAGLVSRLQFRDRIRVLIQTEAMERRKSEAVYRALLKRLPSGERRTGALSRLRSRQP